MSVQRVGVVGTGVMGVGVVQVLAQTGHDVVAVDHCQKALDCARGQVAAALRFAKLFQKSASPPAQQTLERIRWTLDFEDLADVDYVIENTTEKIDAKCRVFSALDAACPVRCVLAANTSAIPIARLAAATQRPDRVIGIHFMNPVPFKPTVELIPHSGTSAQSVEITQALLTRMGKSWVTVGDSPGFVSNRVLMLTLNEAIELLRDNVAAAKDIDQVFESCFGHKMGPLQTADLIGLDTVLQSLEVLADYFPSGKFVPSPLLRQMVAEGKLGRKSGQGFFDYPSASGPSALKQGPPLHG